MTGIFICLFSELFEKWMFCKMRFSELGVEVVISAGKGRHVSGNFPESRTTTGTTSLKKKKNMLLFSPKNLIKTKFLPDG